MELLPSDVPSNVPVTPLSRTSGRPPPPRYPPPLPPSSIAPASPNTPSRVSPEGDRKILSQALASAAVQARAGLKAGGNTTTHSRMAAAATPEAPKKNQVQKAKELVAEIDESIVQVNEELSLLLHKSQFKIVNKVQSGTSFRQAVDEEKAHLEAELERIPKRNKTPEEAKKESDLKAKLAIVKGTTQGTIQKGVEFLNRLDRLQSTKRQLIHDLPVIHALEEGAIVKSVIPDAVAGKYKGPQAELDKLHVRLSQLEHEQAALQEKLRAAPKDQALIGAEKAVGKEVGAAKSRIQELKNALSMRVDRDQILEGAVQQVPPIFINSQSRVSTKHASSIPCNNYAITPDPGTNITLRHCTVVEEKYDFSTGKNVERQRPGIELTFTLNGKEVTLKCPKDYVHFGKDDDESSIRRLDGELGDDLKAVVTFRAQEGVQFYAGVGAWTNCDVGRTSEQPNGPQVMTFCDGCGWGPGPKNAATICSKTAQEYVDKRVRHATTLRDVAQIVTQGMMEAQAAIVEANKKAEEKKDVVTDTTFNQIVVVDGYAVIGTVGDPKTFIIRNGKAIDVTAGGRGNLHDAKDPGGRLGCDSAKSLSEDYRNFALRVIKLEPGDLLVACSDGIHDNLDPETLGVSVEEAARFCHIDPAPVGDWNSASQAEIGLLKQKYIEAKFGELASKAQDQNGVATMLQQHAMRAAEKQKLDLLEGKKPSGDYTQGSGKPDHAGVAVMTYLP